MKYIAYGSNMMQEQMAYRCPDAVLVGTGYIGEARLDGMKRIVKGRLQKYFGIA